MPAAAIEEARESVLGVSQEYDPAQPRRSHSKPFSPYVFMRPAAGTESWSSLKLRAAALGWRRWREMSNWICFAFAAAAPDDSAGVIILPVQRALPAKCSRCAAPGVRPMWFMQREVPRINLRIKP